MKKTLLLLIIIISANIMAQNWSPILVNHKMNYQHSDSSYISHTIWVDSTQLSGTDSIFYLNRVVKDVPGNLEIVLRNQPQFLMEMMVKEIYGIYSFVFPNHYFLGTQFSIGTSWTFDMANNIDAEITELLTENILGLQDSVKVISLSDGNEIRLSKNFGILKFPDFENEGYFELVGIQNTEYGESVPDFWDIFDFEVGDVFQYDNFLANPNGGGWLWNNNKKYIIISKSIDSNSVSYEIEGIWRKSGYPYYGGEYELYSYNFTETINFTDSTNHITNKFFGELITLWGCWAFNYEPVYSSVKFTTGNFDIPGKKYGNTRDEMQDILPVNLYYLQDIFSDTLYRFTDPFIEPEGLKGEIYTKGLGIEYSFSSYWEGEEEYTLEGYIKDGDTVGTITPDSLLIVGYKENKYKNNITVSPNPANNILNIEQLDQSTTYSIELRNLYGQLVKEAKYIQSSHYAVNVSDLMAGVYFYVIKQKIEIVQQGKLIIK